MNSRFYLWFHTKQDISITRKRILDLGVHSPFLTTRNRALTFSAVWRAQASPPFSTSLLGWEGFSAVPWPWPTSPPSSIRYLTEANTSGNDSPLGTNTGCEDGPDPDWALSARSAAIRRFSFILLRMAAIWNGPEGERIFSVQIQPTSEVCSGVLVSAPRKARPKTSWDQTATNDRFSRPDRLATSPRSGKKTVGPAIRFFLSQFTCEINFE